MHSRFIASIQISLLAGILLGAAPFTFAADGAPAVTVDASKVALPKIPDKVFLISDFGAKGDGVTDNTEAINKAIAACKTAGGGMVKVPAGKFITGPIKMVDKMNLHLDADARLLLSNDIEKYPQDNNRYVNGITGDKLTDIAITGPGTIDGQGEKWWTRFEEQGDQLAHRPFLIVLTHCERVLVEDVTITNSPMFHLVPGDCKDVTIHHITIKAPTTAHNTDGIDPSGLNFHIYECHIDTGDDNIAMKPGKIGWPGQVAACQNFTIEKMEFLKGHGMSIGGQTPGGVNGLLVRDCTFNGTTAGIRMKAPRTAGGLVQNCLYENIKMTGVKNPLLITSYYPSIPKELPETTAQPVTKTTPIWKHIQITNLTSEGGTQSSIIGLPEMFVEDVVFTNVKISDAQSMRIYCAKGIVFKNSTITAAKKPNVITGNAEVTGIEVSEAKTNAP